MPRRAAADAGSTGPSAMLRAQHAEATRRAVFAAARSLFGKKGYAQTSVEEIADAARVTKGAVYHHFAGKEALFRAVHTQVQSAALADAAAAGDPGEPPAEQIVAKMDAYLDAALDEEVRRIMLIDGPAVLGLESDTDAEQDPVYVGLRSFIATSIARGQLADLDPGVVTDLLGGLAWLGGMQIARASDPAAARAKLGEALGVMLRGLAPGERG